MTRAPEIPVRHSNYPSKTKVKVAEYILLIFSVVFAVFLIGLTILVPKLLILWACFGLIGLLFWAIITVEKDTWKDLR